MRILGLGAVIAAMAATPAAAQGPRIDYAFTGIHAEVLGGVDSVRANGDSDSGILYGGNIGYDFGSRAIRFGVEGELTDSTARECARNVLAAGDRLCLLSGRDLYAGGRIGVVSGNTLFYAKAGYTNARETLRYRGATPATNSSDSVNLDGIRAGAGVEVDLGQLLLKAEYRYSNYEQDFSRHQGVVGMGVRF